MLLVSRITPAAVAAGLIVASAALGGCGGGSSSDPAAGSDTRLSRALTFGQFQEIIEGSTAPRRVEIELVPESLAAGPLVAREVEIEEPAEINDEEQVRSRITEVVRDALDQPIGFRLDLGGLVIGFDAATRFRDGRGSGDNDVAFDVFVGRVEAALLAGPVPVRAERDPLRVGGAVVAQAPDDPTFVAGEIRLVDRVDEPEIEINVDADNLEAGGVPPVLATITVLGLAIEIRQGVTQLEEELEDVPGAEEFEASVTAVDVVESTFTLATGAVVRVTDGTAIDPEGDLLSLSAVKVALESTKPVRAEGRARVASPAPLVLEALEVKFEVDD